MSNPFIPNLTNKSTPVGGDLFIIADSQNSNLEKNTSITQVLTNNNVVTSVSTLTNTQLPVGVTGNQVKSSGISVDTNQNLTGVGTINGVDITTTLIKTNNLSDVSSVSTSRSNLGLGNAAVKGVTDNTKANLASVAGTFTPGHFLIAADTTGTIQDGGSSSQFLIAGNNLSDVANRTTAFNNIAPALPQTGDIMYFNGTNWVRFGIGSNNYFLSSQGGVPTWAPVTFSNINFNVWQSSQQLMANNSITLINLQAKNFDNGNYFNTTTSTYTPLVFGQYLFTFQGAWAAPSTNTTVQFFMRKNGVNIASTLSYAIPTGTLQNIPPLTTIVSMNGTTDYIQIYGVQTGVVAGLNLANDPTNLYFTGTLL